MAGKVLRVAVLGAGMRGEVFGKILAECGNVATVVAVAEPREVYREAFAARHGIAPAMCFADWQSFTAERRDVDAVIISTMDREHVGPTLACLGLGYPIFLEKPVAPTLEECLQIEAAAKANPVISAVCHSLRYQKGFRKLKEIVDEGRIGRIITLDHLEQVVWWHQAFAYVRGNWGRTERAAFMLMAKSCHDIDYMAHLIEKPCRAVASFGELTYYKPEMAPAGAGLRCTECRIEPDCAYSAIKLYVQTNRETWPAAVISPEHSVEAHMEAVRTGPYGRCVWHCDNDVVDHQVVLMQFDEGITATFTMSGFTQGSGRQIRIHGTEGEIFFDEERIVIKTFADGNREEITLAPEAGDHGGGDKRALLSWLHAVANNHPELVLTSLEQSLQTHKLVFAAERARLEGCVVRIEEAPARV